MVVLENSASPTFGATELFRSDGWKLFD